MKIVSKIQQFQKIQAWLSNKNIIFFVFLFIQNIAIFWEHYFTNVGFPWDFTGDYYTWPAFWTTSISMGIFPHWNPFQSMGYPLAINAQSGLYYPIFWIFPLLHIPYTFHAAVIVQVLHILFGSFGMFLLLKLLFKSPRYALIGAVAFQFFGGFYSNAEHADIIRAFAIAPWLFYVFKLNIDQPKITRRILFIPIVIYFLATGGYPGIFISSVFIIIVFLSLQIVNIFKRTLKIRSLGYGGAMIGLILLGISISAIHLGPIWQDRNELNKFTNSTLELQNKVVVPRADIWIEQVPGLFMSNSLIPGENSMSSIFVALPMLIFASFIPISELKKYWIFVATLILSALMIGGPHSPFWQAITSIVPALKLSRFLSSDYKVFIAIPLIILGIAALRSIIESRLTWRHFVVRGVFVVAWFSIGVYLMYSDVHLVQAQTAAFIASSNLINTQVITAALVLFATIIILLHYLRKNKSFHISRLGLLIIVLLISYDGLIVVTPMIFCSGSCVQTWKYRTADRDYNIFNVPLEKNGKLITYSIFENIPSERPPRDPGVYYSFKGQLEGKYMMIDGATSTITNPRVIVESNAAYTRYMLLKWTPLLLQPNLTTSSDPTRITLTSFPSLMQDSHIRSLANQGLQNQVVQIRYGINDISYKVTLKEPKLMVENEIYFPGWQADLIFSHKEIKIPASVVNDVFRAWLLPAGDYIMIAHFSFPNLIVYQSISIISFGIWIFIIVRYWRRLEYDHEQPIKREETVNPT